VLQADKLAYAELRHHHFQVQRSYHSAPCRDTGSLRRRIPAENP
jgi:hypothetical protein